VLGALVDGLPMPDLVVWLDLPLETAWRRNGEPTTFEVADGDLTWEGFAPFQRRVLSRLQALVADVPQTTLDALAPPDELARRAVERIAGHVGALDALDASVVRSLPD